MPNNTRGKFIVFEGLDGSGKGTQISLLSKFLNEKGISIYETAEPTQSATGGLIRDTLAGYQKRTAYELAALFLTDRIFHNTSANGIKHLLDSGVTVICDRYYYSSFAYQGIDTDLKWVMDMNLNCPEILKPDLCIFLDVPTEQCGERMGSRQNREIFENVDTLNKIRKKFFEVFDLLENSENISIINASRSIDDVNRDVVSSAMEILNKQ